MSDEYEYGPWIGWNGHERPVAADCLVKVVSLGNHGGYGSRVSRAWLFPWTPNGDSSIIAYCVATPKPKRELVVGKWYRDADGRWRQCVFTDGALAWLRRYPNDPAYVWSIDGRPSCLGPAGKIDWSTPPRDEAPE